MSLTDMKCACGAELLDGGPVGLYCASGLQCPAWRKKPEELFYIQNRGFEGNCLRWWRVDGNGYTANLNDAWKVTREKAESICRSRPNEDTMRPASVVDALAHRHLSCEVLWRFEREQAAK